MNWNISHNLYSLYIILIKEWIFNLCDIKNVFITQRNFTKEILQKRSLRS